MTKENNDVPDTATSHSSPHQELAVLQEDDKVTEVIRFRVTQVTVGSAKMLDDLRRMQVIVEARADIHLYTSLLDTFLFCLLKLGVTHFQGWEDHRSDSTTGF